MNYSHNLPPIFVISLKREGDKKAHLKAELSKHKLDYQIIDAVDGSKLDANSISKVYCEKQTLEKYGRKMARSEIGCALSHLSVYQKMLDENIPQAIILEDDVVISDDFVSIAQNINNANPKKWQLILFGHHNDYYAHPKGCLTNVAKANKSLNFTLQKPLTIVYGSYAYLINQDGAKSILSQTTHIYQPIDHNTGDYKLLDVYCVTPICASVYLASPSAIDDGREIIKHEAQHKATQDRNRRIQTNKLFAYKQVLKDKFPILLTLNGIKIKLRNYLWRDHLNCSICIAVYKIKILLADK